jgi:hypothetical protein
MGLVIKYEGIHLDGKLLHSTNSFTVLYVIFKILNWFSHWKFTSPPRRPPVEIPAWPQAAKKQTVLKEV